MGLTAYDILFYGLALVTIVAAFSVVFSKNPIYSALFLALSMSVLGALFFVLEAYFIAVAQITVYAGAVMVLFVMVVMLFDLKHEGGQILKFSPINLAKLVATAVLCGFFAGSGWLAVSAVHGNPSMTAAPGTSAQDLAKPEGMKLPQISKDTLPNETATSNAPETVNQGTVNPDEDLTAAEAARLVEKSNSSATSPEKAEQLENNDSMGSTAELSKILFTKYVFAFEAVSLLLLVAIVGSVALAKSKGGTHHVAP